MADDTQALVRMIRSWAGWRVVQTRDGWMAYSPRRECRPVAIHRSQSDHRALRNTRSLLRKAGAPI